jgi:hypothetical protein
MSTFLTRLFPLSMMICCASARWKLPTETSVYGDKQLQPLLLTSQHVKRPFANHARCTDLQLPWMNSPSPATVRSATPSLSTFAPTMMIRHWAPTILDGYAYHGRPQKPRRLICTQCLELWRKMAKILTNMQQSRSMVLQ